MNTETLWMACDPHTHTGDVA